MSHLILIEQADVRYNRRVKLFLTVFVIVILAAMAGIALLLKQYFAPAEPFNTSDYRTPDGYFKSGAEYEGHDQFFLNGKEQSSDPMVLFDDSSDLSMYGGAVFGPNQLMAGAAPSKAVVVDYKQLSAQQRSQPVEERALAETLRRIKNRQPVNVLFGDVYVFGARNYRDLLADRPDVRRTTHDYTSLPIAYFERRGSHMSSVIVSMNGLNKEQFGAYSRTMGGDVGTYFGTPEGLTFVVKPKGQFLPEWQRYIAWRARSLDDSCSFDTPSTRCLYKYRVNDPFKGHDLVVLTGLANLLEYNKQQFEGSGYRDVRTGYSFTAAAGEVLGAHGPFSPPVRGPGRVVKRFESSFKYGAVYGAEELWRLPAFSMG